MRLIIEARMEDEQTSSTATEATIVAVVDRQERSVAGLGLTLAEGRALLAEVQSVLAHKDRRSIAMRTVFGKVEIPSPRLWTYSCGAKQGEPRRSVSPLCKAVSQRVTPELE